MTRFSIPCSFGSIYAGLRVLLDNKSITVKTGEAISISTGVPHRFVVGSMGGRVVIICPPELEHYFSKVGELLGRGEVSWKTDPILQTSMDKFSWTILLIGAKGILKDMKYVRHQFQSWARFLLQKL
jgi:hypothetical protein